MRWGGSKSQKYAVPAVAIADTETLAQWAHYRFRIWCDHRRVDHRLPGLYAAPKLKFLNGLQPYLEYDFVMDGSSRTSASSSDVVVVFHGTYFSSLWSILHGATLAESTPGQNGSETRDYTPGVYTTPSELQAAGYAWPCNALHDNVMYGVMFELDANRHSLKKSWPRKGEYLYPASGLEIKKVRLLLNIDIGQGKPRCSEWIGNIEITPPGEEAADPHCGGELLPCKDIRRHCWYA